jgi:hypothetical protein
VNPRLVAVILCLVILVPILAGAWWYQGSREPAPSKRSKEELPPVNLTDLAGNIVLGRPTDRSVTANILALAGTEAYIEYGTKTSAYSGRTTPKDSATGEPIELTIEGISPDTLYYYRLNTKAPGQTNFTAGAEHAFHTQRSEGSTFVFGVQGDSHPERQNKMYDPGLYNLTMANVANGRPDLYFTLGDDFSIDGLIGKGTANQKNVEAVYLYQRQYLAQVGSATALYLVNGNHEQAARYLLDGTATSPAVLAGSARTTYYPLPAPDGFYSGDNETVPNLGLPRDYYAFTWGDALFVTIDFYWHSPVAVDNVAGGGSKRDNMWDITLGDEQYQWLRRTLEGSDAKYKFVFCHHTLGTGRGGIELSDNYEWGGKGADGTWQFDTKRPGWELPIHQLMVKTNVTAFFFGHDHLFVHQEKDGVVYQSVPNPADNTYTAFNSDAYKTGDKLPNSGHLRVTVSPANVTVEYVRSWLPGDEKDGHLNGEVAFSYTIKAD